MMLRNARGSGGGDERRKFPSGPRRTQQRDRSTQQRERGAPLAGGVADASAVRSTQREGRAGGGARRTAFRARGGGAGAAGNHRRITAGRTCAFTPASPRPASLASRSAPRTNRAGPAGQ